MIVPDRHRRAAVEATPPAEAEVVEFEAGPVGRARGGPDPIVLVSVVVTGLLVVAVLKPWGPTPDGVSREAFEPQVTVRPTRPPSGNRAPGMRVPAYVLPVPVAERMPLPPWSLVLATLRPHAEWGARAVLEAPVPRGPAAASRELEETWTPASPAPPERREAADGTVVIEVGDRLARLIGVTMPDGVTARNVRVSVERVGERGRRSRVNVVALLDRLGGAYLFAPATLDGRINPWPTGTYHVDLLADGVETGITIVLVEQAAPA